MTGWIPVAGSPAEVFSNHDGGAAQEAVRGGRHPRYADRDEPFHSSLVGIHDLGDDVWAAGRRSPVAQPGEFFSLR
jgi:hypothetical protein